MSFQVEDEDDGGRLVTFDVLVTNDWGPRRENGKTRTLTTIHGWLYDEYLYRLPSRQFVRVRHRYNLNLRQTHTPLSKRLTDEEAAEWLLAGGFDLPSDIAHLADKYRFSDVPTSRLRDENPADSIEAPPGELAEPIDAEPLLEPSEQLRESYHDPSNYWRNVWLYKQKESGAKNSTILAQLKAKGREFFHLESTNALRNAVDTIARHHNWPQLKGAPGKRPKGTKDAAAEDE